MTPNSSWIDKAMELADTYMEEAYDCPTWRFPLRDAARSALRAHLEQRDQAGWEQAVATHAKESAGDWLPDAWTTIIIENIEGCYSIEIDQSMYAAGSSSLLDAMVAAAARVKRDSLIQPQEGSHD